MAGEALAKWPHIKMEGWIGRGSSRVCPESDINYHCLFTI